MKSICCLKQITSFLVLTVIFTFSALISPVFARETAFDKRMAQEIKSSENLFSLTPHKQNYILPFTYNSKPNNEPFDRNLNNTEIKLQISIKAPYRAKFFHEKLDLLFAYTNQSYWQAYDGANSSPFRETNHEPEAILRYRCNYDVGGGIKNRLNYLAFNHQSNGQSGSLSRSWNRVYFLSVFEKSFDSSDFYLAIKPWVRIHEDDNDDDNPDIEKFLGYGEITASWYKNSNVITLMFRNNLRSENRGAIQLDWSYPMADLRTPSVERTFPKWLLDLIFPSSRKWKLYIQFFNGYGESLIDYNHSVSRIGVGIMLINWL